MTAVKKKTALSKKKSRATKNTSAKILEPLKLPCGAVLQNRLAKAAMSERVADGSHEPNEKHINLYQTFAQGGPGLLITGNVMINRHCLESAGNVVVEDNQALAGLRHWASVATSEGSHLWAQIGHSGRQTARLVTIRPVSASDVQLHQNGLYAKPRPLTTHEIKNLVKRFGETAAILQDAGFTGVEIHAAHGYLLSQFLSPLTNLRVDQYGGSLENRARFLKEVFLEIRSRVGNSFAVAVKLNSADFQRGGFDEADSLQVIKILSTLKSTKKPTKGGRGGKGGLDLLEISGGNYESPSFFDINQKPSTRAREAYFIDFANKARKVTNVPLMITGGFRSRAFVDKTLANKEADVIGMARPFLLEPNFAYRFLHRELENVQAPRLNLKIKKLQIMAEAGFYNIQMQRLAKKKDIRPNISALRGIFNILTHETIKSIRHRLKF